jgi:hypothetical protein
LQGTSHLPDRQSRVIGPDKNLEPGLEDSRSTGRHLRDPESAGGRFGHGKKTIGQLQGRGEFLQHQIASDNFEFEPRQGLVEDGAAFERSCGEYRRGSRRRRAEKVQHRSLVEPDGSGQRGSTEGHGEARAAAHLQIADQRTG